MSIFQRVVLLLKVLVMLSLGTSSAWASSPSHPQGFNGVPGHDSSGLMIAASEPEGSKGDDDSTTDEPDPDSSDDEEGDSQS